MRAGFPLPSYAVGPVRVAPGLVLAPMSGVTDSPFRRLVKRCSGEHVGLVMSEFIQIEMLTRGQLRGAIRMAFHPSERPLAIQLYGADPELMADAAMMVEDAGADMVDINCGCPAPKICRRGGGAGLLRELPRLAAILQAVTTRVAIPVTVKIRNGWDASSINAVASLRVAEDHGAAALALHGRTRMQLYTGSADWEAVADLKRRARIPILGSGDILTPEDARRRLAETACDGLFIGRGAITNPWLFRQIAEVASGLEPTSPTWRDIVEALRFYLSLLDEHYPPRVAPGRMRMMLSRFLKGFPTDPELRVRCLKMTDPAAMLDQLELVAERTGVLDRVRQGDTSASELDPGEGAQAA
jgi:nifR3 family TIM-barrel protein